MDTLPIPAQSLENYYHINGAQLECHYKEHLSGFADWQPKEHAHNWLLFPQNMGPRISIDETALSNGELYTLITNKEAKGRRGTLIAIIAGTCSDKVNQVLQRIPEDLSSRVQEVTLDMSTSMRIMRRY